MTQFLKNLALMASLGTLSAFAGPADTSISRYDLFAKGLRVGHVETIRARVIRGGRTLARCEVTTAIKVNLLVFRYALASHDVSYSENGSIVEFARTRTENGRTQDARGVLRDGIFHFDIVENGQPRMLDIPRGDYEFVSLDSPEQHLILMHEPRTFKILSTDSLSVVDRTYTLRDDDRVSVAGKNETCRVVDFVDPNKSGRRWFIVDDLGLCIIRQDGRDKAGKYSLRMTSNEMSADRFDLTYHGLSDNR